MMSNINIIVDEETRKEATEILEKMLEEEKEDK